MACASGINPGRVGFAQNQNHGCSPSSARHPCHAAPNLKPPPPVQANTFSHSRDLLLFLKTDRELAHLKPDSPWPRAAPELASVRMLPWAKANLNPTGQALIICAATGMAYFVAADKKILSLARRHSFEGAPEHLKNTSYQGTGRPHPTFFRP